MHSQETSKGTCCLNVLAMTPNVNLEIERHREVIIET